MADANARGLGVRETGAVVGVGSGRVVVVGGGEGGVDGDGGVGPVLIACDNFDGARGPCNRKNQQKIYIQFTNKFPEKIQTGCRKERIKKRHRERGERGEKGESSPVRVRTAAVRPGRCLRAVG